MAFFGVIINMSFKDFVQGSNRGRLNTDIQGYKMGRLNTAVQGYNRGD